MTVFRLPALIFLSLAVAANEGVSQQTPASRPMWADSTGEPDTYPFGDAVDVYRAVLDLLYIDGKDHPPYAVLVDSAIRMAWVRCTNPTCPDRWAPKSSIDSATLEAYLHPSLKRPRIVKFRYRIPIELVSSSQFERFINDGYAVLAGTPPEKLGGPDVFWAGFTRKYPKAWGYAVFSKIAFNPAHTQALIAVYQNCGNGCYSSESIFLKRFGKDWRVMERIPDQVEIYRTSGSLRYRGPAAEYPSQSQVVATDSLGGKTRAVSDDAPTIYGLVLERLYSLFSEGPRTVVLTGSKAGSWVQIPPHRSRIDSSTIATYKLFTKARDAVRIQLKTSLPVTWVSDSTLKQLEQEGAPLVAAAMHSADEQEPLWLAFHARYPTAWGYTSLSNVGFNPDHSEALVSTGHFCGSSCSNADFWFLERKGDTWYIVERIPAEHGANGYMLDGMRYLGTDGDPRWYRPRRLQGLVTDAETGKPLPRIQLEVVNNGQSSRVDADDEGHYLVTNLRLGGVVIRTKCPPGSPGKFALGEMLPVTPGMDSTVNVPIAFAECAQQ